MVLFPELVEQLGTLSEKIGDILANLFRGKVADARRTFEFAVAIRTSLESGVFNKEIRNDKFGAVERNFIEYCRQHIDAEKTNQLIAHATALLGLLGSPRFVTGAHTLVAVFDKDLKGVTESDVAGNGEFYHHMFREEVTPLLDQIQNRIEHLISILGELQRTEKQKEARLMYIVKEPKYAGLLERPPYKDNLNIILYVEDKIEDAMSRNDLSNTKIAGIILAGEYAGRRHARLPMPLGNHRIVYDWNRSRRILTYIMIGTHKELGIG